MRYLFRYITGPVHTQIRLFAGPSEPPTGALGKCGDLIMRNEEWELFRKVLEEYTPGFGPGVPPSFEFQNEEDDHSTLIPR